MISHREPVERAWDQLDAVIQWALSKNVADASPPPGAWERIAENLPPRRAAGRGGMWRGLEVVQRVVTYLLGGKGFYCAQSVYSLDRGRVFVGRPISLFWLMCQCDLPPLLAEAV